jgi:hypothetical protein
MENKDGKLIYNSFRNNWITPYFGDDKWINETTKFEFLDFEHLWPDLIWLSQNTVYGFEHFYVDSSEIKKGSKLKSEISNNIEKSIIPQIEVKLRKENIASNSYKFNSVLKYENLKNNTFSSFDKHYKNIKTYNKNIIKKYWSNQNIKIIFYIEYNILPSVYLVNWKPEKYFYPFNDINFLNYFSDKKDIKWIIFSINSKNHYISIQNKYIIDNENIFNFTNWIIEDFEMNQATVWVKT